VRGDANTIFEISEGLQGQEEEGGMTIAPCPCCQRVTAEQDIIPDGYYSFGGVNLVSWRCRCGTNRAIKFESVSQSLRRAALMAMDDSPEMIFPK
jgi:hypothetical protein